MYKRTLLSKFYKYITKFLILIIFCFKSQMPKRPLLCIFFRIVSALKYFYNDNAKIMFCEIVISRGNYQPRLPPHLDTDSNPQTVWQKGICVEAPVSVSFIFMFGNSYKNFKKKWGDMFVKVICSTIIRTAIKTYIFFLFVFN